MRIMKNGKIITIEDSDWINGVRVRFITKGTDDKDGEEEACFTRVGETSEELVKELIDWFNAGEDTRKGQSKTYTPRYKKFVKIVSTTDAMICKNCLREVPNNCDTKNCKRRH